MNALIDLNQCREFMTVNINGKDHLIKLAGTIKQPYFCGKDICEILDHKDSKYALKTHVPPKYKKELTYFYGQKNVDLRGGNPPPQNMVICSHNILGKDKITFREGQTIYVSEPGLYALIMNSKTMFASIFQELVYETILPSIRAYGCYQVETQLSLAMEKLAIKEKSEEDLLKEQEELQVKLEREKEARVKAERKAIRVNKFMKRITVKEKKMEWIYIATNKFYAQERLFKIGSTTRLSSRISSYNTGRAKGVDQYYYAWAIKCYNSKDVDYHIQKLLADFKWNDPKKVNESQRRDNRSEMYHGIKFIDLKAIVTFIVNNYDASIDYINNFIKTRLDQSMEEKDEIPPPLDYKRLTYQIGEYVETIDLEEEESDSIREAFEDILLGLKEQQERHNDDETVIVQRKDIMNRLSNITSANKKDIWNQIKELTGWISSKREIDEGSFKYKITY